MARKFSNFVFTINNWTQEHKDKIAGEVGKNIKYIIYGEEIAPSTNTPHLQGYCELDRAMRMTQIFTFFPQAHLEKRRGTQKQAIEYCKKEGQFTELGEKKEQGKRTDLAMIRKMIFEENATFKDIIDVATGYQGLRAAQLMIPYRKPNKNYYEERRVFWFHGPTGKGKTRKAMEMFRDNDYWISSVNLKWFDGYWGQKFVLIDDFRKDFCTFHFLLRITDKYPLQVPIKGGFQWWEPEYIVITSCFKPEEVYNSREDIEQLLRRIYRVVDFEQEEDIEIVFED